MIEQFAGLADAVAHLRAIQQRQAQAGAAVRAAELLGAGNAATTPVRSPGFGTEAQRTAAEDFAYDVHAIFAAPQVRSPRGAPPPPGQQPRSRGPRR